MTCDVMASMAAWHQSRFMIENAIKGLLLIVAVIHLLPVVGFFGTSSLQSLYGLEIHSPDLEVLMRHRAMLFGILGALFAYAAFHPPTRPVAYAAAAVSLLSFFYLAATVPNTTPAIRKIVIADLIATAALALAILGDTQGP
jgi:hypothetical protein